MKRLRIRLTNITAIAAMILMAAFASSCHSSKSAQKTRHDEMWHDVRLPVRIELNSPMNLSLSGKATMVRDSMVNISMTVFGFEVAVAHMTPDSVYFVDKHNKYYFAEPLSQVMGSHNLSISAIQDLILGAGSPAELSFKNPGAKDPVVVKFRDFTDTPYGKMASTVNIAAPVKDMDVDASLVWGIDKARWNEAPDVKFKTPGAKYKRITMQKIRSMFKSMM